MGDLLPDGTIIGYEGYCSKCGKIIKTNMQGNETGEHECKKFFKKGERVKWTYKHWLNSNQFTYITKVGTVINMTGIQKKRYISGAGVNVLFDGNKHPCIKPVKDVFLATEIKSVSSR